MRRFIRTAIVSSSLGLLVLSPGLVSAAGGKVTVENERGPLVNAWFSAIDGCVETDTFVSANRAINQQQSGGTATTDLAAVGVFQYDTCTGATLLDAVGQADSLPANDLQISRQLDWATLHTTITMTNIESGAAFDVAVDVEWVGTSDITRDHSNTNDLYGGGCHVLNRWKGSGREADASGTVSTGVTNFTPAVSDLGEIGITIGGFEVIGCA